MEKAIKWRFRLKLLYLVTLFSVGFDHMKVELLPYYAAKSIFASDRCR